MVSVFLYVKSLKEVNVSLIVCTISNVVKVILKLVLEAGKKLKACDRVCFAFGLNPTKQNR